MSLVRRVKSFSVKKYKSNDELKTIDEEQGFPQHARARKKKISRQKSLSMESVPLRIHLEKSDLFQRQKHKLDQLDVPETRSKVNHRKTLEKRESLSLDDLNFTGYFMPGGTGKFSYSPIQIRKNDRGKLSRDNSRFRTVDVTRDLITEFADESKDAVDSGNKLGSFPVFEDDTEVQVRGHSYNRPAKVERPKTFSTPVAKKKEESFDFRGPCRVEIGTDQCLNVTKTQRLRLTSNQLEILDESGTIRNTIKTNLKKGTKFISKKEVEMIDFDKTILRFQFETTKDAKLFAEMEKARPPTPKDKSTSPFSITQLLKLLKKRSSRDLLESKGIIKNEPIFGNTLEELCDGANPVPEVITRIVELIEEPENITSLGLYRASANLAVVQHIRCEINCGRWDVLQKYRKEVDVLAGTLKLFFRELKEPIIPYQTYQLLLAAIRGASTSNSEIGNIVDSLPEPNRATLLYIIEHLLNVCRHKSDNKMDIHNMAICWGPSLIMFADNCVDLVAQTTEFTAITEHLLLYYQDNEDKIQGKTTDKTDFVYQAVQRITELVESNLTEEGIYRKSGSTMKIEKIMRQLDLKNLHDLDKSKDDVHELCCVLKKFLGNLKDPLVPNQIFDRFSDIHDSSEEVIIREVRGMVEQIPRRDVLLLLLQHLRRVVKHEKSNKMSMAVMTDIWMTTLANPDVQQYKKKMQIFAKLFKVLMNLNEVLPDLLPERDSPRTRQSKYDNIPDIKITDSDRIETKL